MQRYMALYFPHIALDRLEKIEGMDLKQRPLILKRTHHNRTIIEQLNEQARLTGIKAGMTLTEARALCHDLITHDMDDQTDLALLEKMAEWCHRYTPSVRIEAPYAIIMDITGCAHLFGGEEHLRKDVLQIFEDRGYHLHVAIAPTKQAALGFAQFGSEETPIIAPGEIRHYFAHLPVASLGFNGDLCDALAQVGLRHVQDLYPIGRAALARRFGLPAVRMMDSCFGIEKEAFHARGPSLHFEESLPFPEPVMLDGDIRRAFSILVTKLCKKLDENDMGARRFRLTLSRVDDHLDHLDIAMMTPGRDVKRITRLFEEKMSDIRAGFGLDGMSLSAHEVTPLHADQTNLIQKEQQDGENTLVSFLDHLQNKIGLKRSARLSPQDSWAPESRQIMRPLVQAASDQGAQAHIDPQWHDQWSDMAERPLYLLKAPILLSWDFIAPHYGHPAPTLFWQGETYHLERLDHQERVSPPWWQEGPLARVRDYYQAHMQCGARFWVFAIEHRGHGKPKISWHLHGFFAG